METHTQKAISESLASPSPQIDPTTGEFLPGSTVIYAMHGRCNVLGVETRNMGKEPIRFYKLEVQKSALSRSARQEPAIWVPVVTAKERGLRAPISKADAEVVMKTISSREYFFNANESWSALQPKLEASIRNEGAIGLAKVISFLHVLKRKQVVPSPEVTRMNETVHKLLIRELSEATGEQIRVLEERIAKGMKQKLIPDN